MFDESKSEDSIYSPETYTDLFCIYDPNHPNYYRRRYISVNQVILELFIPTIEVITEETITTVATRMPDKTIFEITRTNKATHAIVIQRHELPVEPPPVLPVEPAAGPSAFPQSPPSVMPPLPKTKTYHATSLLSVKKIEPQILKFLFAAHLLDYNQIQQFLSSLTQAQFSLPNIQFVLRVLLTQAIISANAIDEQSRITQHKIIESILLSCFGNGFNIVNTSSIAVAELSGTREKGIINYASYLYLAYRCYNFGAAEILHQLGHQPLSHFELDMLFKQLHSVTQPISFAMGFQLLLYYQVLPAKIEKFIVRQLLNPIHGDPTQGSINICFSTDHYLIEIMHTTRVFLHHSNYYNHAHKGRLLAFSAAFWDEQLEAKKDLPPLQTAMIPETSSAISLVESGPATPMLESPQKLSNAPGAVLKRCFASQTIAPEEVRHFEQRFKNYVLGDAEVVAEFKKHRSLKNGIIACQKIAQQIVAKPVTDDHTSEYKISHRISYGKIQACLFVAAKLRQQDNHLLHETVADINDLIVGSPAIPITKSCLVSPLAILQQHRSPSKRKESKEANSSASSPKSFGLLFEHMALTKPTVRTVIVFEQPNEESPAATAANKSGIS